MFIDTHSHPLHSKFAEAPALPLEAYLQKAHDAKVNQVLGVACRRAEWAPMLQAASQHPSLRVIAGIHPHDATENATPEELDTLAQNPLVVGIGETGLDYFYTDVAPKAAQHASFHDHMEAAKRHGLPAIIHTREAEADTISILREHAGTPFVLHCFSGTAWLADEALALGGYLSFSGILTFDKKAEVIQNVAKNAPRPRVLIETDAPYLAPTPHRGKRNASSYLPHTAQTLASLWQVSLPDVGTITTANAKRLFTRLS